jgi:arylsulfatase A-like enzyme
MINRKHILSLTFVILLIGGCHSKKGSAPQNSKPNILILLTDQWRAQSVGYANNQEDVKTPNLDKLASHSANFKLAVSNVPTCTPFKASLQTGQRPLTNGVFMNDVRLDTSATTIAEVLNHHGYQTGFIGKWHIDGQYRCAYIPPGPRRQGYQYWKAINCDHNYRHEAYYTDRDSTRHYWKGFAAISEAQSAQQYIHKHAHSNPPFYLLLSWATPHSPYHMAPKKYKKKYKAENMWLPPNVPDKANPKSSRQGGGHYRKSVRRNMAGYYANISVLDAMIGKVIKTLKKEGVWNNTIILFTSDHGDMLGSQGLYGKQVPYDESIRVPMLFHYSGKQEVNDGNYKAMISSQDIMPTLLGLAGIKIPTSVEGKDFSGYLRGGKSPKDTVALIESIHPFGNWSWNHGGRAYRGIRTPRYTYVRDLKGPWLLFDNKKDQYQLHNLIGNSAYSNLQAKLNKLLDQKLKETGDHFRPGSYYVKKFHYPKLDTTGTVPYVGCKGKVHK